MEVQAHLALTATGPAFRCCSLAADAVAALRFRRFVTTRRADGRARAFRPATRDHAPVVLAAARRAPHPGSISLDRVAVAAW
jgi:hypothetical protein